MAMGGAGAYLIVTTGKVGKESTVAWGLGQDCCGRGFPVVDERPQTGLLGFIPRGAMVRWTKNGYLVEELIDAPSLSPV